MSGERCLQPDCRLPAMSLYAEGPPAPDGMVPLHLLRGLGWCPRHGPSELYLGPGLSSPASLGHLADRSAPRGRRIWRGTFEDEIPEVAIIGERRGLRRVKGCAWESATRQVVEFNALDGGSLKLVPRSVERLKQFAVSFELEAELRV